MDLAGDVIRPGCGNTVGQGAQGEIIQVCQRCAGVGHQRKLTDRKSVTVTLITVVPETFRLPLLRAETGVPDTRS